MWLSFIKPAFKLGLSFNWFLFLVTGLKVSNISYKSNGEKGIFWKGEMRNNRIG